VAPRYFIVADTDGERWTRGWRQLVAAASGSAANRLSRMIAARGGLRDRPPVRRGAVSVRAAEKQRDRHLVDKI